MKLEPDNKWGMFWRQRDTYENAVSKHQPTS